MRRKLLWNRIKNHKTKTKTIYNNMNMNNNANNKQMKGNKCGAAATIQRAMRRHRFIKLKNRTHQIDKKLAQSDILPNQRLLLQAKRLIVVERIKNLANRGRRNDYRRGMLEAKVHKVSILLSDPNISADRRTKLSERHLRMSRRLNDQSRGCGGRRSHGSDHPLGKGKGHKGFRFGKGMCHGKGKGMHGKGDQHPMSFQGKGKGMCKHGKGMRGGFDQEFEECSMHLQGLHGKGKGKGIHGKGKGGKGKGHCGKGKGAAEFDEFELYDDVVTAHAEPFHAFVLNDYDVDDELAFAIALSMEDDEESDEEDA